MENLKSLLHASSCIMYVKDSMGKIELYNEAFANLHGLRYTESPCQEQILIDYSFEKDFEVLTAACGVSFEEFFLKSDGQLAWFHTFKLPYTAADGSTKLLSASVDITEAKNAPQNLTAPDATALLTDPEDDVSNDSALLRDLGTLVGYLDQASSTKAMFAVEEHIPLAALAERLQPTGFASPRSAKIIWQVEDQHAALRIATSQVQGLVQAVEVIVQSLAYIAKQTAITISAENLPEPGNVLQLKLEFRSEIVSNTQQTYTLANGDFLVHCPPALTISFLCCASLLQQLHGQFAYRVSAENELHVIVRIPARLSEETVESRAIQPSERGNLRVLLLEDNHAEGGLAHLLKGYASRVDSVSSAEEACAKLASHTYDFIFIDTDSSTTPGMEICVRLRAASAINLHTPIIACTGNDLALDTETYRALGIADRLLKPYKEPALFAIVTERTADPSQTDQSASLFTPPENEPLYDFSGLGTLASDRLFVRKMQRYFVDHVPEQLDALHEALAQQDWASVSQITHRLKATLGNIRIREAEAIMKEIEKNAIGEKDATNAARHFQKASQITHRVIQLFKLELDS
ncbi:response regulator [Pontibacter sp. E15-1]|uniref:response regulator n=1 Tax=Pontibacter sp. E15-1 TaxID=2919918 RepID=UPI001F50335C|nr:response regulator [Pontibacter sp. E15-1]MCJ8163613.1 response regulator [Pontibacter sp. E15-1]